MRYLLIALLLLFVGFFYVGAPKQISDDKLWIAVNQWRVEQGKPAYKEDQNLCGFADQRIKEVQSDWSHDGFKNVQNTGFRLLGENLSSDMASEKETLNAWLKSESHRKNLNDDFTDSCIRCENNYCVQLFGKI